MDDIRRRVNAASVGPWIAWVAGRDYHGGPDFIARGEGEARIDDMEVLGASPADLDFIAAARQDVPALLDELERCAHGNSSPKMSDAELQAILERAERAIAGPW